MRVSCFKRVCKARLLRVVFGEKPPTPFQKRVECSLFRGSSVV